MKIQINNQDREFFNEFSKVLHNVIGTKQRVSSLIKLALWTTEWDSSKTLSEGSWWEFLWLAQYRPRSFICA